MALPPRSRLKKDRIRLCAANLSSRFRNGISPAKNRLERRREPFAAHARPMDWRMRRVIFLLPLLAAGAMAQQASLTTLPPDEPGDAVFHSEARLVILQATATGPDGHLVTNLPQYVFRVFENDVPQEISLFKREDAPISLGLLIDASSSMRDKREKVAKAALTLVRASNPSDEVFIMGFHDQPWIAQDF